MTGLTQRWRQADRIAWIWPLLACLAGWWFVIAHFHEPVQWDPQYTYLPAARAFLQQGWSFLLTLPSCHVAPLGYLWPALWGVDPTWIRIANMGLWAGCVGFLWRTGCLLGGRRAGVVAMLLLALSDLRTYFPSEMTEPIYLFGVFGLIHALARLIAGGERTFGAVAQGAVMLTITMLSRPILQWIAPAALLACLIVLALRAWRSRSYPADGRPSQPTTVARVALCLSLGLLIPLAWVVMNGLASGFWGLRTGAGVSLYLGTHPLFQGTEPAFLGGNFDVNALLLLVTGDADVLSPSAEPVARAAALWQIQSMSLPDAATFFSRKLWWWLADHPAEIQRSHSPLRQLRLFQLSAITLAALWAAWGWRHRRGQAAARSYAAALVSAPTPGQWTLAALLLGTLMLLVGQLIPVFYNSRYGTTMLDPWLIPLTAFGLALVTGPAQWRGGMRPGYKTLLTALAALAVIAATTSLAWNLARRVEHLRVDATRMGAVAERLRIADTARTQTVGMTAQGERQWVITQPFATLMVSVDQSEVARIGQLAPFNALWDTELALRPASQPSGRCRTAEVAWQTAAGAIMQPTYKLPLRLPVIVDGQFHHLITHANAELRPSAPGSLRITLDCPIGTVVQWRLTRFLESRQPWNAAAYVKPHP